MNRVCVLVVMLFSYMNVMGQSYEGVKTLALKGQLEQALEQCDMVLSRTPGNIDFINLRAWIFSRRGAIQKSIEAYTKALQINPVDYDALEGVIRGYYRISNFQESLGYANKAIINFPNEVVFLLLKSQNLKALDNYDEALFFVNRSLNLDPDNPEAISLRNSLKSTSNLNQLSVGFTGESYQNYYSSIQNYSLEYSKTTNWGALTLRVQNAQRGLLNGMQYEIESYPRFGKGSYGFIQVAVSNQNLFPTYRYGFDFNHMISKTFGMGVGIRSMHFQSTSIDLIKITAEKYYKSFRFEASLFSGPGTYGTTQTFLMNVRNYFNKSTDFLSLTFGNAISPDAQGRLSDLGSVYKLKSNQLLVGSQVGLGNHFIVYTYINFINNELPFEFGTFVQGQQWSLGSRFRF